MEHRLIEIKGEVLFEEYLHSLGVTPRHLDQEQEIYLQDRHLAAIRRVKGELRFFLHAAELTHA
ncbi:hypothetical protein [Aeromonas simiae]|uniref:CYTH domain-containing protein n=1 Tax=Aeromonas simiae TaxID=218936 RepID=A0A5J6X107_9GAMM|nr:hypothetical protein [Aeromonas simiae]MDO2949243.1 hypothetical protein [Aeromonas simiae]MDO2952707.1 hypothetical protein [Aeromonas simiae]MDO2956508.1 hypothetical protein [Aeromonas simiae]QFI56460.1 hypothetical protein FE240_18310 [Aeromonas simiae]